MSLSRPKASFLFFLIHLAPLVNCISWTFVFGFSIFCISIIFQILLSRLIILCWLLRVHQMLWFPKSCSWVPWGPHGTCSPHDELSHPQGFKCHLYANSFPLFGPGSILPDTGHFLHSSSMAISTLSFAKFCYWFCFLTTSTSCLPEVGRWYWCSLSFLILYHSHSHCQVPPWSLNLLTCVSSQISFPCNVLIACYLLHLSEGLLFPAQSQYHQCLPKEFIATLQQDLLSWTTLVISLLPENLPCLGNRKS